MNNMKAALAATAVIAVLALIVGFFAWQTKDLEPIDAVKPTKQIVTPDAQLSTPEATFPAEALNEQLFDAVTLSKRAEVERLLEAGADPNARDASGDPILKLALYADPEILSLFIAHGANVNAKDGDGNALLPQAVIENNLAMVESLVDAGADVDSTMITFAGGPNFGGYMELSALGWSATYHRLDIAEFLVARGADVSLADRTSNFTPLHLAASDDSAGIVRLLLDHGADPDAQSSFSVEAGTPLHLALESGSLRSVEALLDGGAEVDIRSPTGQTPLMYVLQMNIGRRPDMVTMLLEHGADPNLQNKAGNSALHQAVRWDRIDEIRILVEHGASLELQNNAGKTAVDLAVQPQVVALLRELGAANYGPTPCDEIDGTCLFLHFDGEFCTYVGPDVVGSDPVTFIYHNESQKNTLGALFLITGDQTLDDYIEKYGVGPSPGRTNPMWTALVHRGNTLAGETHTWQGQLDEGTHIIICSVIVPSTVWYGGGFTVEY